MKNRILTLSILLLSTVMVKAQTATKDQPVKQDATQAAPVDNPKAPKIVFDVEEIDYGTIDHYADGNREFSFKNTGKEPLVISNCQGSCGCTVPTWPKEPIAPGKKGVIHVKYATDRVGHFEKTVTVTTNASNPSVVLKIKGDVKAEPATMPTQDQQKVEDHPQH